MTSGPTEAVGEGDPSCNILAHQDKSATCYNDAMIVKHVSEASASHVGNPSYYGDQCSQEVELPIPLPPLLVDQ